MKQIHLTGSWVVRASRDDVYAIVSDFEKMPMYFPQVAQSLRIVERTGNRLKIEAEAKSFGTVFPVAMTTELLPMRGFISDNINDKLGTFGHEELLLEETAEGTRIDYSYRVTIKGKWLRLVARPLLGWFGLWFWKQAVIDRLAAILEKPEKDELGPRSDKASVATDGLS